MFNRIAKVIEANLAAIGCILCLLAALVHGGSSELLYSMWCMIMGFALRHQATNESSLYRNLLPKIAEHLDKRKEDDEER